MNAKATVAPGRLGWLWPPLAALVAVAVALVSGGDSQTVWYLIRAAGIVAYLLLFLAVVGGLLMANRSLPVGEPRVDLFELHRFCSLLVLGFGGFHALALLLDSYVGFTPKEVLVPFASSYLPVSVGLGTLTLYLGLTLYLSFYVRRLIGHRTWRVLHGGSFVAFLLAALHGLLTGSDAGSAWLVAMYVGTLGTVWLLLSYRLLVKSVEGRRVAERPHVLDAVTK